MDPKTDPKETEMDIDMHCNDDGDRRRGQYQDSKDDLLRRLRKIEGQIRGLQRMIEEDRYCVDVLIQLAAVRAALNQVGLTLMASHTRGCVTRAIRDDHGDEAIEELMQVVMRFVK